MLSFNPFDKFEKLYTRKHLFDRLTRFCIKHALKSIVKNKVFLIKAKKEDDGEDDKDNDKDIQKKKKMLLGY